MTYKFQRGAAVLSGSIKAEEGLDAGSSGVSAAGAIAGATTISGSATTLTTIAGTSLALQSGGITAAGDISGSALTMTTLAGTFLALQSGGITNAGAIAGATTISGSGAISGLSLDIEANGDIGGDLTVGNDLTVTNALTVTNSDLVVSTGHISASSGDISGSGNLYALGNLQIGGNATITGDLTINGTTTTVNSTTLTVDDTNITIADGGDANNATYGLTIGTTNAVTFQTKQTNGANSLASSVPVSASTYYGSGANLSGITADVASGFSITGYNTDNYAADAIISTAGNKGLHAWASANVTASYTFDLSGSYSSGNIVIIKGHSATATYPITIRPNDNTTYGIDGDPSIALESNNASVTLIYNGDGGNWTII
jgi:cytoskeletal protein CcmA (bactofilin family)